jgi:hypothetical protein
MEKEELKILYDTEARSKSNTKRIDEQDKKINNLEKTYSIMEKMDFRMGKVENAVERIDTKLENSEKQKSMKWDKLIDYLFYAILAYALFRLGLK